MRATRFLNPAHWVKYVLHRRYFSPANRTRARLLSQSLEAVPANAVIAAIIEAGRPALVGRVGGTECINCWHYLKRSSFVVGYEQPYPRQIADMAHRLSGITPTDDASLDQFCCTYLAAVPQADVLCVWDALGMYEIIDRLGARGLRYIKIDALEPWDALKAGERPWPQALAGKRVLVVHPFARSVEAQYARRTQVKTISRLLPAFDLATVIPPVTFAGCDNGSSWMQNYSDLCARVAAVPFDVALIGCGAYGMPLGAFVKQLGRTAIVVGGATQLLFGIRGRRWDVNPDFSPLMDETWVRPSPAETPPQSGTVEDACYW